MKESNLSGQTQAIDLDILVKHLLSHLKPRPKEILARRFGLDGKKPQVLDKIGRDFGITRERVRQIERDSFKKLRSVNILPEHAQLIEKALQLIIGHGGFCDRKVLKEGLRKPLLPKDRNQLMFILNSSQSLSYNKGSLAVGGFWFLKDEVKGEKIMEAHSFLVKYLKEKRVPLTFEQCYDYLQSSPWQKFFSGEKGKKRLGMVLNLSREVERNILGEWGIKNWRLISERGTREKSFLVLRKYLKPLHFVELTELINKHWPQKRALPQTVHNELIKDKRFILVGRGMYGLRSWGFDEGTVKEIIVKLLKSKQESVKKDDIIEYVLTKKRVKKTTVMVNLADRGTFHKDDKGLFRLKAF